ncbi:ROK family protein [Bullifex sp.]|uniref:ROK family protein n=1 Tax=Bullifex sp. TaxID=2815808 RepID=UPI002A807843|nr:ROK family protein [Bullifex sp.]MDY4066353.1 ROK family protein [Bullifex sp.]
MPINNNIFQKNANTALVTQAIWLSGEVSRVDISRSLHLYRSTVTNIISFLLDSGVVLEGETSSSPSQGGRKPILLKLNDNFGCVFGIDIQPSHYRLSILSFSGKTLCEEKGSLGELSFEEMVWTLLNKIFTIHKEQVNTPVLAICFSIPGVINNQTGEIIYSNPFKIGKFNIRNFVKTKYNYPIYVENDANCAAWLDIVKYEDHRDENMLVLVGDYHEDTNLFNDRIGIGLGIGVVIDGKVYHGSHFKAGEFCSISWYKGNETQNGIPIDVLKRTIEDEDAYYKWFSDTMISFVPMISVMDFKTMIFHGKPFSNKEKVMQTIKQITPTLLDVLEFAGTNIVFDYENDMVGAKGAAMMFLSRLFSVPELMENSDIPTWDELILFANSQKVK